jgi:hypothetical protein
MYYFPWPLLPNPAIFNFYVIIGLIIVLSAVFLFRYFSQHQNEKNLGCCSFSLPCDDDGIITPLTVSKEELNLQTPSNVTTRYDCA